MRMGAARWVTLVSVLVGLGWTETALADATNTPVMDTATATTELELSAPATRLRLPSLAPPLVFLGVSAGMLIVGLAYLIPSAAEEEVGGELIAGAILTSFGAQALLVGLTVFLPVRMVRRRHTRERMLGVTLSPSVDPFAGRYGLAAALRF